MQFKGPFLKLTFIYLTVSLFCSFQKVYEDKEIKPTFSAQVDNSNDLSIRTTLTNSSADTMSYVSMSCSWQALYSVDTNDLKVYVNECDKNVPRLIKLSPHSKQETVINLISNKSDNELKGLKFRIGLNFIRAKDSNEMFTKISELGKMKNVIWSETLNLK